MAYFSKQTILEAYSTLSKLTNDPSQQGATQFTSCLRYLFAMDRFYMKVNKSCDSHDKNDRDLFTRYVGEVVAINSEYYTANFYDGLRTDQDYKVGSNFFSVNVVRSSKENPSKEFEFPQRQGWPAVICIQNGNIIRHPELFKNVDYYLSSIETKSAFAVWLVREMQIDANDIYDSIKNNLKSRYSSELISKFLPSKELFVLPTKYSLSDVKARLDTHDFTFFKDVKQEKENIVSANKSNNLLPAEELIAKVREAFKSFLMLTNFHMNDYDGYISQFENTLNPFISKLGVGFDNVFQIVDLAQYKSIISNLETKYKELAFLALERENGGNKYMAWTTHRYYLSYLNILSEADFRANIDAAKPHRLAVATATSDDSIRHYLRAMRTKPFLLLAGISGTGKSRIVKELAFDSCPSDAKLRDDKTRPGNYCLIEVKPNWHDSTELLGYQSAIAKTYVLTPFVKFLAKAMLYPNVPFFVCLDEMNLAPVEQYFAEFLSVLESRKKLESGEIVSEPLIKADVFKVNDLRKALFSREEEKKAAYDSTITDDPQSEYSNADEQAIYEILKRDGLRIPQNVIVIGTVNMDETTHQFSRKVIDRAMTIEMNLPEDEPFMKFFDDFRELGYNEIEQPKELYLASEVSADKVVAKLRENNEGKTNNWLLPEVAKTLTALNEALEGTPFKVAYRVQNEMMLYFGELWGENTEAKWREILTTTVDQILMMKVLPRVEGDEDLLEKPLERLATFCANYPHAAKKVAEMKERLSRSHFASYWP